MQKLWLKNFEFHINPAVWNTAQDLVQAGGVKQLREVEKHFWVATVEDGELVFEVEAMITPHKIKAFTCECWAEGRRLMCAHVAAALFKVRQFLEQKAEARQARIEAQRSEELGRLTVQTVLANASLDDLTEFVREYARRDRDFSLALKTWFAASVEGVENTYALVLDAALPRNAGTKPLREPEFRRLRKTLDDLETQCRAAHEQGYFRTVFQITTALLHKLPNNILKIDDQRREQIVPYLQTALHRMIQIPGDHLSPELRDKRRNFLFEYLASGNFPPELERELLRFLGQAASDEAIYLRIRDLYDQIPFPAPPAALYLFLTALAQRGMPEAVARVLEDFVPQPARIKEAVVALFYLHEWKATLLAGEAFLDKNIFNAGQRREIEDLLLLAAEKTNDTARQKAYLRQRYRQYGHPEIFQRLKTLAGADWPAERERLIAELHPEGKPDRLAPLFAAEGNLDALERLLAERKDLSLLRQFEDHFLPERKNFVRDHYVDILAAYLRDHFGRQASGQVREQLAGLIRKGQGSLAKEIILALIARFSDRHTLPEELAELFPKTNRPNGESNR